MSILQNRAARLALISSLFTLNEGNTLSLDSVPTGSVDLIERIKQDDTIPTGEMITRGEKIAKLDAIIRTHTSGLTMDGLGESEGFGLDALLNTAIQYASKTTKLTTDSIDLAIASIGHMVDSKEVQLYMDGINSIKGVEILTTAILVQLTQILSCSLPFDGAIGDAQKITTGNGKAKLAVYSVNPVITKGMGDASDGDIVTPSSSLGVFANSTRRKEFVVEAGKQIYTLDLKNQKDATTNYKMERGVNEVVITGVNFPFNDFDVSPKAINPSLTYEDDAGETIKVEWKYNDGQIVVTFSDETEYIGEILSLSGGLSTENLSEITGESGNEYGILHYVSRVVRQGTTINLLNMREMLAAPSVDILSGNLETMNTLMIQEEIGNKIRNATRFAKKATSVGDLDISATGGGSQYDEQAKAFIVAVRMVAHEILADSTITSKVCLVGGSELESVFEKLRTHDTKIVSTKFPSRSANGEINSVREIGSLGDIRFFIDPTYDERNPKTTGGYSRVDIIGTPSNVALRPSQSAIDLPLIPVGVAIDKNSNQTVYFEGKLMSESNKNPNSMKLCKYLLFKQ
jgi:hypothetical protein